MKFDKNMTVKVMGILNVTPDSFSDGGEFYHVDAAVKRGLQMMADGADILDIGGESTRPGAEPVSLEEEQRRILPVIKALSAKGAYISVDTRHAETMEKAIKAGASIINDVNALRGDGAINVASSLDVPVCLMHMLGQPKTMQENPNYDDVVTEIVGFLQQRVEACLKGGIKPKNLMVDPGIGFGKTLEHNLTILQNLDQFKQLGLPILLGASRKRFIGMLDSQSSVEDRLGGSIACALHGYKMGANIIRVHDVKETAQALKIYRKFIR